MRLNAAFAVQLLYSENEVDFPLPLEDRRVLNGFMVPRICQVLFLHSRTRVSREWDPYLFFARRGHNMQPLTLPFVTSSGVNVTWVRQQLVREKLGSAASTLQLHITTRHQQHGNSSSEHCTAFT